MAILLWRLQYIRTRKPNRAFRVGRVQREREAMPLAPP